MVDDTNSKHDREGKSLVNSGLFHQFEFRRAVFAGPACTVRPPMCVVQKHSTPPGRAAHKLSIKHGRLAGRRLPTANLSHGSPVKARIGLSL